MANEICDAKLADPELRESHTKPHPDAVNNEVGVDTCAHVRVDIWINTDHVVQLFVLRRSHDHQSLMTSCYVRLVVLLVQLCACGLPITSPIYERCPTSKAFV